MKKNGLIIVLIVIILGLGVYIFYDKVINKTETSTTESDEINNNDNNTNYTNLVTDAYNKEVSWNLPESVSPNNNDTITNSVILPKLNINNENATKLNQKILDNYKDIIKIIDNNSYTNEMEGRTANKISYEYMINDNIVYMIIYEGNFVYYGSGSETYKGYYYDLKNNVELSAEDICKKYNITVEDINKKIDSENSQHEKASSDYINNIDNLNKIIALKPNQNKIDIYIQTMPAVSILTLEKK